MEIFTNCRYNISLEEDYNNGTKYTNPQTQVSWNVLGVDESNDQYVILDVRRVEKNDKYKIDLNTRNISDNGCGIYNILLSELFRIAIFKRDFDNALQNVGKPNTVTIEKAYKVKTENVMAKHISGDVIKEIDIGRFFDPDSLDDNEQIILTVFR